MNTKSTPAHILPLVALMITALAVPPLAGSDAKAERELEIMTGILETTLGFLDSPSSGRVVRSFGTNEVEGYLLPGQGVVFLVSLQPSMAWPTGLLEAAELADIDFSSESPRVAAEGRLEDLRAAMKRDQEETRERLEKHQAQLEEAKRLLVEAVAEYGDSFTTLEDDDFINLILRHGGRGGPFLLRSDGPVLVGSESPSRGSEVISIRRSEIREYKSGSLGLDQLTAKVLQR